MNDLANETIREARHLLHEHLDVNLNPSDVANLADSLERTIAELRGQIEWHTASPLGWHWVADDEATRCSVCDRDEPGLSHASCNRAIELGVD